MKPKIIFTGGGTAGHVTPNLALIEAVEKEGWQIDYIGSKNSVEQGMIEPLGVPFHAISSGKLRRYFSWKNFLDPFFVLLGMGQAFHLIRKLKADVVFSKGGFVAFPVVFAAWLNRVPVIAHESDLSPGLANRLSFPFVNKICVTFEKAKQYFKQSNRVEVTGTPLREELLNGSKGNGLAQCGFIEHKPCLLVIGGSQGSHQLNKIIRESLPELTRAYQVIHLCGKGKVEQSLTTHPDYFQLEYANQELADLYAAADIIISRAGANSLYEILALKKPHILVPLSAKVSRGDQVENAAYFEKLGISYVVDDDKLTKDHLLTCVDQLKQNQQHVIDRMNALKIQSASMRILAIIKEFVDVGATKAV